MFPATQTREVKKADVQNEKQGWDKTKAQIQRKGKSNI